MGDMLSLPLPIVLNCFQHFKSSEQGGELACSVVLIFQLKPAGGKDDSKGINKSLHFSLEFQPHCTMCTVLRHFL